MAGINNDFRKAEGYKRMVGGYDSGGFLLLTNSQVQQELHIPLDFWFNINAGLSLPLIALQYHEVRFIFHFLPVEQAVVVIETATGTHITKDNYTLTSSAPSEIQGNTKIELFIDYIYLDTDERRRFAQMSHEYLIEQVQASFSTTPGHLAGANTLRLNFNHPCKEIMFFFAREDNRTANDWFNFSTATAGLEVIGGDVLKQAVLKLNGHNRFTPERGPYSSVNGNHSFITLIFLYRIYMFIHLPLDLKSINHPVRAIFPELITLCYIIKFIPHL